MTHFTPNFTSLPPGSTVLVGLSGGADSVSLLLSSREAGFDVHACHVHHGLRGAEADADAAFCEGLCASLGVPCAVRRLELPSPSEESARKGRYAALIEEARRVGAAALLLAHNASDDLETALLNLARGTGAAGLGMPASRVEGGVRIVRPLLGMTREAIDAYVAARGVEPRVDGSNLSDRYARNRLRHHVLPVLRALNPRAVENASRALAHLRADEALLSSMADDLLSRAAVPGGWDASALLAAPQPIRARAFIRLFGDQDLTERHIDALTGLCAAARGTVSIDLPGKRAVNAYGVLSMAAVPAGEAEPWEFSLVPGETYLLPGGLWRLRTKSLKMDAEYTQNFHNFYVDSAAIHGILSVSGRRAGDAYIPHRRGHTVSLKKEMIDRKIPVSERPFVPVIRDGAGIVAVAGIGVAERCAGAPGNDVIEIVCERAYPYPTP